MLPFVLAFMAAAQVTPPVTQQTAFFCLVGEYDVKKRKMLSEKPIRLNVLLAGHPLDVNGKPPVKTYDPARLIGGETFDFFAKNHLPGREGYVVMTQGLAARSGYLLTLEPIAEKPGAFSAVVGPKGSDLNNYVGQCFGPVAPIDEATFDQESKK